jgi:hypothetical protein
VYKRALTQDIVGGKDAVNSAFGDGVLNNDGTVREVLLKNKIDASSLLWRPSSAYPPVFPPQRALRCVASQLQLTPCPHTLSPRQSLCPPLV